MSDQSPMKIFEEIAKKTNESVAGQSIIKEWVGPYDGKILQFETDTKKFYLVIADGKMEVCTGEYPSPDLTFRGSSQVIIDVFTGKRSVGEAIKRWDLLLMGAGHEGFMLGRLITTIFPEA
jgi:putative sterol carrier protein